MELPSYVRDILKKYPKIKSGRKNFKYHHKRIIKIIEILKKYKRKINN